MRRLLENRNHAVVSTLNADGSIHSTVVWASAQDGKLALNSAVGRKWPNNLERDPRATVVIYDEKNPYDYVEVTGTVSGGTEGADAHIDALAKKYLGVDSYPYRTPDEQRITYLLEPTRVRHQKQG
ncbi:MAG TPA: PPOX class F420-dependent oxidoreductase [Mycobacteriales bacterium]|nr:PPOX class F420-dependent oxidoreductase [Mycobacteriales bacterium]